MDFIAYVLKKHNSKRIAFINDVEKSVFSE